MNYQVIIIEDDPMVADIDRQYVEMNRAFRVGQVFRSSADALDFLAGGAQPVDLIILDYYTPAMTGLQFVDRLHALGLNPAIIMVTSANEGSIVQALLDRGVMDYLVKPFRCERFQQALERFLERKKSLTGGVDQQTIDRLIRREEESAAPALEKGLNTGTLERVREFFRSYSGPALTSEQIAEQVGLSRITVRRYVGHMAEHGELDSFVDYQTGGRPCIRYTAAGRS